MRLVSRVRKVGMSTQSSSAISARFPGSLHDKALEKIAQCDESACCECAHRSLLDRREMRIAWERAAFEVDELVGESATAGRLAESAVDVDAVSGPGCTPARKFVEAGDRDVWIAVTRVTPGMPPSTGMSHKPD